MKIYRGYNRRTENGGFLVEVIQPQSEYDATYELDPRHDLMNHSPNGFAWGYGGSGPAQLALAILADLVGDVRAFASYQTFKARIVSRLHKEGFHLTEDEVLRELEAIEKEALRDLQSD